MLEHTVKESSFARLLKYSYGGFVASVVAVLIDYEAVQRVVIALGPVLSPLAAIGLGVCIYVLHREVWGELVLYRFLSFVHDIYDQVKRQKGVRVTNTLTYLGSLGVQPRDRRAAYNAVRNSFFKADMRARFDLLHTELHLLWITVDVLIGAIAYQLATHHPHLALSIATGFLVLAAIVADIRQHQVECHQLKIAEEKGAGVSNFLRENLYIEKGPKTSADTVT